jgi:hypothetical protein
MHSIVLVDDLDISLSDVFGDPVMTTSGQPLALLRNCLRIMGPGTHVHRQLDSFHLSILSHRSGMSEMH